MNKRIAILDLGTNTFNLLIAELLGGENYKILVNQKLPVKLGEKRINSGKIISVAFNRGIEAIKSHFTTIKKYQVQDIKAYGTSALRTAKNGEKFLAEIRIITGITVEIISGDLEAELIYFGVRQTLNLKNEKFVILDIGGGSNEFILANMKGIIWKKSYPLGIARLFERFRPSDPISVKQIEDIFLYLEEELEDLFLELKKHNIEILVGASGSFETFYTLVNNLEVSETECDLDANSSDITLNDYHMLYQKLVKSTLKERKKMKGLEPMRVEMIVLASIFVEFILKKYNFKLVLRSNFALKEGAVYKALKNRN